ncbi:MAG: hypothetical protein HFG87_03425 [Dorea sp.]|nr:hypothetical protein [Dorea sp.]
MIILMLFYLWYGPQWQRRKTAERMIDRGGSYQLMIGDDYIEAVGQNKRIKLKEMKLKFYVSGKMYILRADREIYAIPRRILGREREEKLVQLARKYRADTVNVVIKKE